ncbi:hypothetical protein ASZ90_002328 [hydrocarbon metagenome]|uniref:Uncharacterized protein n=1 Tax=hydrocarbon metagenome TaxID=938273 RepID=A0A0W8G3S1_9ZZZZ
MHEGVLVVGSDLPSCPRPAPGARRKLPGHGTVAFPDPPGYGALWCRQRRRLEVFS